MYSVQVIKGAILMVKNLSLVTQNALELTTVESR